MNEQTNLNWNKVREIDYEYNVPTQIDEKHKKCGLKVWYLPQNADCNPHSHDAIVCTICNKYIRKA